MIQRGSGTRFAFETLQGSAVIGQLFRQELQSHRAAQLDVLRLVNHSHAPAAQDFQNAVVRDPLAKKVYGAYRLDGKHFGLDASSSRHHRWRAARFHPFHRNEEPIASSWQCLDVTGHACLVPQSTPQSINGGIDAVVELDYGVVGPKPFADLFAQYHLT